MEQDKQKNIKTADIVAETLLDWGVDTIFGIPGDGINGFIEAVTYSWWNMKAVS